MEHKPERRHRTYTRSGFHALKRVLADGPRDGRSALSRALASWRGEIESDLGGDLSAQERTLLEIASGDAALLALADAAIGKMGEGVVSGRGRNRAFVALVADRQRVAQALADRLRLLGLKRRPKPVPMPWEWTEEEATAQEPAGTTQAEQTTEESSTPAPLQETDAQHADEAA